MYWEDKEVVVTGGYGFVGQHLVPALWKAGAYVHIASRKYPAAWVPIADYCVDVGDIDECKSIFEGADAVFNLAAVVGGQKDTTSWQARHFYANVRTQCAAAIAAFEVGVPIFIQVSSVSAYAPEHSTIAIEENADRGQPVYGYGFAKRMGEQTVRWLCEKDSWKGVNVRLTNMYGEHDHFGPSAHIVPYLIQRFAESNHEPVILYGNGKGTRDLMHAEDGARGMMAAAEWGIGGRLYNLGTEKEITIRALAEKIRSLMGSNSDIWFSGSTDVVDERRQTMSTRALNELGWQYQIELNEGLARAVAWYKKGKGL